MGREKGSRRRVSKQFDMIFPYDCSSGNTTHKN